MVKLIMALCFAAIIAGCANYEIHMLDENAVKGKVMISEFQIRDRDYDPFLSREFSDVLRFEFFKRGFEVALADSELFSTKEAVNKTEIIKGACRKTGSNYFIEGTITKRELGFLLDKELSSYVSIRIYNSLGVKKGEASYTIEKSFEENSVQQDCAERFAESFIEKTENKK